MVRLRPSSIVKGGVKPVFPIREEANCVFEQNFLMRIELIGIFCP